MKHIRLFEDYSDEELRDLQDDLHGIGHKTKFVQGEDFGFGRDFKSPNNGVTWLRISKEMFDHLLKRGELKNYLGDSWRFVDPEKFGIPISDNWPEIQPIYWLDFFPGPNQYYIEIKTKEAKENYEKISQKLGEIRK
jgi:hypothetical protein